MNGVRATAIGDFVTSYTNAISAIWFTRSPNRLITWPIHSAENEPLRPSRTYGWRRTRSRTGTRRALGTATPIAPLSVA